MSTRAQEPLEIMLPNLIARLKVLCPETTSILQHTGRPQSTAVAWKKLRFWENDIREKDEETLKKLPIASPVVADMLRARFDTLEQAISEVESQASHTGSFPEYEHRYELISYCHRIMDSLLI
jgi:hypothetical protein